MTLLLPVLEAIDLTENNLDASDAVARVKALDWLQIKQELNAQGSAVLRDVLSTTECNRIASSYMQDSMFRSRVVMTRHGFGRGEYKYFSYPLPEIIAGLRAELYAQLAPIANEWNSNMGLDARYPEQHSDFIQRCHEGGQQRPTPLLLQYKEGDYNCLHQDLYGDHVFPIQVAILLSEPGRDLPAGSSCSQSNVHECSRDQR